MSEIPKDVMDKIRLDAMKYADLMRGDRECMHEQLDRLNPEMVGRPRMLSCPCPKCTPRY